MRRIVLVGLLTFIATACSETSEINKERLSKRERAELEYYRSLMGKPVYGEVRDISGVVSLGSETFDIELCDGSRESCTVLPIQKIVPACNLEFTDSAREELTRITKIDYIERGSYFLEGRGRTTTRPGHFGHISRYLCQVELSSVVEFEEISFPVFPEEE